MGWMELLVVGVVALIVVGPKDLPVMFQTLGRITAKVKRMAREFQAAMSDAAKASGTSDISRELKDVTSPKALGIDRLKSAADSFERWDPMASKRPESGSAKSVGSAALTEERAGQARLIRENTAKTARARLDREADGSAGSGGDPTESPVAGGAAVTSGAATMDTSVPASLPEPAEREAAKAGASAHDGARADPSPPVQATMAGYDP